MKYDDAAYCFLNFENDDLPTEDGATHIGMYFAWNALRGLAISDYEDSGPGPIRSRQITGRHLVVDTCDCRLSDGGLNDEGNGFAQWHYEGRFLKNHCRVFDVSDDVNELVASKTPSSFDRLAHVLDARFEEWKALS